MAYCGKIVIVIFVILAVLTNCQNNHNENDFRAQRDSVTALIQRANIVHIDTALLEKALAMTDALLEADTSRWNKVFCHYSRSGIYAMLGKTDEAMRSQLLMVQSMTENNPERLFFMAAKNVKEENKDSANYYIDKLLNVCNGLLGEKYDENVALYKMKALYLRYGNDEAKSFWKEQQRAHPENYLVKDVMDDWDNFIKGVFGEISPLEK